jgi:uncharacterized RDD family membrane protein YckC
MKNRFPILLLSTAFAWLLAATGPLRADEQPVPPSDPPPAEVAAAAADEPQEAAPATDKDGLRRLDQPAPAPAAEAVAGEDAGEPSPAVEAAPDAPDAANPATPAPARKSHPHRHGSQGDNSRVAFGGSSTLAEGDVADAVVSIFGSSTSAGEVRDAVVSVFGSTRVTGGSVGDAAVAVFGSNYVNAHVHGDVVAVMGSVELGPRAVVDGEVVCVGSHLTRDPAAVVHGGVQHVSVIGNVGEFGWLHAWIEHCLFYGRPLAFAPGLGWAWAIALVLLGLYILFGLLAPGGVNKCVKTFEERPGYSLLTAVLVTLLTPVAFILLLITIVGAPALVLFLFGAGLFGKAVMFAWIGRRLAAPFRAGATTVLHPVLAVLIGGVIVVLLYTVPILGFVLSKLLSWIGLGVVVYTIILAMKREKSATPPVPPAASKPVPPAASGAAPSATAANFGVVAAATATATVSASAPAASAATVDVVAVPVLESAPTPTAVPAASTEATPPPPLVPPVAPVPPIPPVPPLVSAVTLPRAGFWIRLLASVLDAVLIGLVMGLLPNAIQPNYLLLYGAYCAVMWALKSTTVGGVVCGLKVVRLDDRKVDWMTGVVRSLGGFLSFIVAGLGFIWVAFDDEKQSWHDKIAGTTVVIVPKGVSLI